MTKKYYWLKLNKDFFSRLHIKLLRREPYGAELVVIYLKLLLAAINSGGTLSYGGSGDLAALTALDIDEDEEKVRALLDFLSKRHLAEIAEDSCFFAEAEEAVGQENRSATRMRRLRGKKAELKEQNRENRAGGAPDASELTLCDAQCDADVTLCDAQCDAHVTPSDACSDGAVTLSDAQCDAKCDTRERDRERDRDRDRDRDRAAAAREQEAPEASDIFSFYERHLGPLTAYTAKRLSELKERLEAEGADAERQIRYGIEEAAANNARSFAYVRACAEAEAKRAKSTGPPKARQNDVRSAARKVEEELRKEGFL